MRLQDNQVWGYPPSLDPCSLNSSPSTIHELAYLKQAHCSLYILRDDLLCPPFSGSKHRKYQGLFTWIRNQGFNEIVIPGSIASNHVVTALYLSKTFGLTPYIFTKKPYGPLRKNAEAVIKMTNPDQLFFYEDPHKEALDFAKNRPSCFVMPLGGFSKDAAMSALSLGYEIANFNNLHKLDHVILDAGTGLQAASCLVALEEMGFKGQAHVICMGPLDFKSVLEQVSLWTQKAAPRFKIHVMRPFIAKAYGSSNRTLKHFQDEFFQKTGIVLDTVYNAKSFYTMYELQKQGLIQGNCLIVHSGGTYSA